MGTMINRRRVCGGKNLPYDYEVEYFQNDGYVVVYTKDCTGISEQIDIRQRSEAKVYLGSTNNYDGVPVCGRYVPTTNNFWFKPNDNVVINIGGRENYPTIPGVKNKIITLVYEDNIVQIPELNYSATQIKGSNTVSTTIGLMFYIAGRVGTFRIYYYKLWDLNGVLIHHYIPVVKDGVCYFYDTISGVFYWQTGGSGTIVPGPRVS